MPMQVLFTGRLLRGVSASAALAALPLTAGLLMGAIALSPTPATVAGAEVLRKVGPIDAFAAADFLLLVPKRHCDRICARLV